MDEHGQRHPLPPNRKYAWLWNTSDGNTKMVSCLVCGYIEAYNPQIHTNVMDAEDYRNSII
jgi:hypothetical protein